MMDKFTGLRWNAYSDPTRARADAAITSAEVRADASQTHIMVTFFRGRLIVGMPVAVQTNRRNCGIDKQTVVEILTKKGWVVSEEVNGKFVLSPASDEAAPRVSAY